MILTATDLYTYLRPSKCDLRIYLKHRGEEEAPPGPYEEVLRKLGIKHEQSHLKTFPSYVDLSSGTIDQREHQTKESVAQGALVLYQPVLRARMVLDDIDCEIIGEPDYLIHEQGRYIVRDSKISRRITEKDHPEILHQLEIYGWLFKQNFGQPPLCLQVHSGTGDIVDLPYGGGLMALNTFREILALKLAGVEPFHPVGWSKCSGCGYNYRCWPKAVDSRDVAIVYKVDQGLVIALREKGIRTFNELLGAFDEASLAEFKRLRGGRPTRVGKDAVLIMRMARAMAQGEFLLQPPNLPEYPNYVMFDLEGIPPHLDEANKIYLWGLQVFGDRPSKFQAAEAGFGKDGDREGWEKFLRRAKVIFAEYGDIKFVHWHRYEADNIANYVKRYGDPDGIAAQVQANLLDLHPITQNSIALPLPSYSLKVVEKYIGFQRTLPEGAGDWAMARYIEATEMEDEDLRAQVLDQIKTYNREDLEATWAILKWLKSKSG